MADLEIPRVPQSPENGRSDRNPPRWFTPTMREAVAELCGTFVLMIFGMGSVAQLVLSDGKVGSPDQVRWSWGFGVTFGVYVAGGISGGHLNPAVTLALCVFKKTSWTKLIPYWIGQYLGSFIAACVVFLIYYDAILDYKGGHHTLDTAAIFATYPSGYLSLWNGLADQIFATAVLMLLIMALTDPDNMAPSKGYLPVVVGLVVTVIGMTFSLNCGYAINPARDLSPRLFTLMAGWGKQVFSVNDYKWFWIPVVGPYVGAITGAWIYVQFIQMAWPCSPACCMRCTPSVATFELERVEEVKATSSVKQADSENRSSEDIQSNNAYN